MRVGSSPDKAGTGQYYQMVRVRRTRREGVTRVNQWLNLRNCGTGSNLVDMAGVRRALSGFTVRRLRGRSLMPASEAAGKACGVPAARLSEQSWAPPPSTATRSTWQPCRACPSRCAASTLAGRAALTRWARQGAESP